MRMLNIRKRSLNTRTNLRMNSWTLEAEPPRVHPSLVGQMCTTLHKQTRNPKKRKTLGLEQTTGNPAGLGP